LCCVFADWSMSLGVLVEPGVVRHDRRPGLLQNPDLQMHRKYVRNKPHPEVLFIDYNPACVSVQYV
jgi:hypothetical protein